MNPGCGLRKLVHICTSASIQSFTLFPFTKMTFSLDYRFMWTTDQNLGSDRPSRGQIRTMDFNQKPVLVLPGLGTPSLHWSVHHSHRLYNLGLLKYPRNKNRRKLQIHFSYLLFKMNTGQKYRVFVYR